MKDQNIILDDETKDQNGIVNWIFNELYKES